MVKAHKLHKIAGISAGFFLFVLAFTGFLLDHKQFSWLYSSTLNFSTDALKHAENRLFTFYRYESNDKQRVLVGSYRGIFHSLDGGKTFTKLSDVQALAAVRHLNDFYIATSDGVYKYANNRLEPLVLQGEYVTALSLYASELVAVVNKKVLVRIDVQQRNILTKERVEIEQEQLQQTISLSRLVRDIHYGRGLFDDGLSLLYNDYAAVILMALAISGYVIYYFIRQKKQAQLTRKLIRFHASGFSLFAILGLILLALTGLFLDHTSFFSKFLRTTHLSAHVLPPIYSTLHEDIWGVDIDAQGYRIGNRYGVYKSIDREHWVLESPGFAYKMLRKGSTLYVSGMGAPSRRYEKRSWHVLHEAPHMFKDVIRLGAEPCYLSHDTEGLNLPKFATSTLYTLMFTIHDGTLFGKYWVFVNDAAALALLILLFTGIKRWYKKRQ